ncbi:hypothetical protein AC579_10301 [Pseudocercospora musae]|uniref:HpcH/HpaI aldolase/citrate lyase domain-containing protein n=1 Tax=Pseudocercospora musae TaxID=113226 RepID=A0A139GU08_9PEZI|nr:hypothetical protein AC579_10301 [Pseudocercospora musae]
MSQIAMASHPSTPVPYTRLLNFLRQSTTKPSIGSWLEFPGYTLASTIASFAFYDWILIDYEHGDVSDTEMYHSVAAMVSQNVSPIVRIPGSEP